MKVEVITPSADPDRGGFGCRVNGLVSMFARFSDVRVVLTDWFQAPSLPGVQYEMLPLRNTFRTRLGRLRTYYRDGGFPRRGAFGEPDLVVVESLDLLGLHQYGPDMPMVLDEHNVYWNLLKYEILNAPFFRGPYGRRPFVRRLLVPGLLARAKRFEIRAIERATRMFVTSETDRAAILAECPNARSKVRVLPNCVDTERIPALPDPEGSRTVAFVGDFNYIPNQEAAEFVSSVLAPSLQDARFLLVGSNGPKGMLGPNIRATGHVPDLLAVLKDTAVCISPLFHGSGTRLKILTYLAASRPVVATTKACEGLPVEDGYHLLIRDEPTEFREAVQELLNNRDDRRRLGAAGRELVESEFDWRAHVPTLQALALEISGESRR